MHTGRDRFVENVVGPTSVWVYFSVAVEIGGVYHSVWATGSWERVSLGAFSDWRGHPPFYIIPFPCIISFPTSFHHPLSLTFTSPYPCPILRSLCIIFIFREQTFPHLGAKSSLFCHGGLPLLLLFFIFLLVHI
ncbi:hypothetical protein HOY82DRAFT_61365 [Tuber indicum]|nr:hypothetical protein HOY82DRAFT_61365 [Tuber indicum]